MTDIVPPAERAEANASRRPTHPRLSGGRSGLAKRQLQKMGYTNVFNLGDNVVLTAIPSSGQSFNGWTGDLTGTQNPVNVTMNQSKVIRRNVTIFGHLLESIERFVNFPVAMGSGHESRLERRWSEINAAVERSMKEFPEHLYVRFLRRRKVTNRSSVEEETPHRSR